MDDDRWNSGVTACECSSYVNKIMEIDFWGVEFEFFGATEDECRLEGHARAVERLKIKSWKSFFPVNWVARTLRAWGTPWKLKKFDYWSIKVQILTNFKFKKTSKSIFYQNFHWYSQISYNHIIHISQHSPSSIFSWLKIDRQSNSIQKHLNSWMMS